MTCVFFKNKSEDFPGYEDNDCVGSISDIKTTFDCIFFIWPFFVGIKFKEARRDHQSSAEAECISAATDQKFGQ
jgi:hypothetical protein